MDFDILVGAERVVKEEAEEVGSDVAEGRAVLEWNEGFGSTLDWPGVVKLEKKNRLGRDSEWTE